MSAPASLGATPMPTPTVSGAALGGALRPSLADLRLAGPAAVTWIVVAVLVGDPDAVGPVAASAAVVGLASLVVLLRTGPSVPVRAVAALVLTTALLVALTAAAVAAGQERRLPSIVRQTAGHSLEARVRLDRDLTPGDRSVVGTIEAVVGRASRSDGLRVPVRLVPALDEPRRAVLAAGTVVSVRGQLQRDDPGSATSVVLFARGAVATRAGPTGLLGASADARAAFVAVTADLPEPGGPLLRGLAIGDRSGLDAETEQAMETSALTHLTAVSGSNCAVLVGLVVLLGRLTGAPRVLRAAAAVVVLLGFVVLVRPDPSITRATVMAIVVLVVHLSGRPVRGVPLIALAAVGMLVADPWVARSFAFALSVLATVGIVVLAAPLTDLLARWIWTPVAAAVAIPIAAQVACWPVTIPLAPALPTYAVPANLLAEVLAPVATIVGLAACLLAPVWPVGAGLLATVGWVPAAGIGLIAHGAAGLPVASAPWPSGPGGVVAAGVVSAALAVGVLVRARLRRLLSGVAALTVIVGIGSVTVPAVLVRGSVPTGWTIAMCDVGQGDATLLRSAGRTALVDTGDDDARLTACLALLGVDRIDLLVLTHFDRDHVGAVASVATRVETALVGPVGRPADDRVVGDLRSAGVDVRQAADRTTGLLGDLRWQVLWPPEGDERAGNAASLVLRVDPAPERPCPGCVSAVLLGDLGEDAQRRLSRSAPPEALAPVDVVKVAHHGSADQDPELYRVLGARVGLIGVGADNDYGHPTPSALEMLAAAGTMPYRTDRSGTIVVRGGSETGDGGDTGAAAGGSAVGGDGRRPVEVWTERDDGASVAVRSGGGGGASVAVRKGAGGGASAAAGRTRDAGASAAARRIGATPTGTAPPMHGPGRRRRPAPPEGPACPPRSPHAPQRRSTRSRGRRSARPRSSWSPAPRRSWRSGRSACSATCSSARTRRSRCTTSRRTSTPPDCCRPWRAPRLFGEPRLVRVTNVEKCTDAFITETISYLQNPADDVTLVLRHGGGVRGKKLLDTIRSGVGGGIEVQCDEIKRDTDRIDFVNAEFRAARRKIAPSAVRTLVAAFADDLAELAAACRQLLADEAAEITDRTVDKYYGGRVETNAFKVADIALAGRSAPAIVELRHALATGEAPVPIVAAFASKIRTMAKVSSFRGSSGQAASALGMAPWQVQRAQRDVAGWSEAGLANAIMSIATADAAVKGGSRDAHFALEVMVRTIARRGEER